jgi:hypothetical protein
MLVIVVASTLIASARADGDRALNDAQDAFVHGQYNKAIELATTAIDKDPLKAWRIIGASHCFLNHKDKAAEAYAKLDKQGQQFLKYVCQRNKIVIGD